MRDIVSTFLVLAAFAVSTWAGVPPPEGEVRIETSVEPTEITIGDIITYHVKLSRPEGVRFPDGRRITGLSPFEILDVSNLSEEKTQGRILTEDVYRITVYETGDHRVPAIELTYRTPDGTDHRVQSEEHAIRVVSVIENLEEAQDIQPLKEPLVLGQEVWKRMVRVLPRSRPNLT